MLASQCPGPSSAVPSALSSEFKLSLLSDKDPGFMTTSPHELPGAMSTNDSPTSRHPPDTRQNDNNPRSVVIQDPPKMGYTGVPKSQMSMDEVPEKFAPSPSSVHEGRASSSSRTATTSKFVSRTPAYYPASEDVSGSLVFGDANRIWQVAPYLSEPQFKDRQRVSPVQCRPRSIAETVHRCPLVAATASI